jgi:hypothetical protein
MQHRARIHAGVSRLSWLVLAATFIIVWPAQPQTLTISQGIVTDASVITLSDFNITGSGSNSTLFQVTISALTPTQVTMAFTFDSQKYGATIVEAKTNPFLLSVPCTFTNRDFGSTNVCGQNITVDYINFNTNLVAELQDAILRSGRLPNDTYTFRLVLAPANGATIPPDTELLTLDVSNPTTLSLVSPGSYAGAAECYQIFTTLPLFQWDSNIDRFELTICEQLPTNASPEDVMQNQPRVQATLLRGVNFDGQPSFLYPSSGALPLQPGHTYYWQVAGIASSPSGDIRLPSEIWCFQLAELGSSGAGALSQQLLGLLSGLGVSELEALFAAGGPLEGFSPTGVFSIEGKRVDMSELMTLLNQLRSGTRKMTGVMVE